MDIWMCPQCKWSGQFKAAVNVVLAGVVSPYCPMCWAKVVPMDYSIGGHMFEYLRLDMNDGSHPIQWEQLGRNGWELVTIHKDVAYFKRVVDVGMAIFQSTDGQVTITPPGK